MAVARAAAWFTPVLMSYVVVGILWMWIYNYDWGPINATLRALGLDGLARPWLGDPDTALPALILVTSWMWVGFNMVVMLAALHSLPTEVIEAAELNNCGGGGKLVGRPQDASRGRRWAGAWAPRQAPEP